MANIGAVVVMPTEIPTATAPTPKSTKGDVVVIEPLWVIETSGVPTSRGAVGASVVTEVAVLVATVPVATAV